MAPRNLRKKRVADSDDEEDHQGAQALRERMEDAKMLIKNRAKSKGVGAEALAVGSGKKDTDADDDVDEGKHAQFAAGAAVDVDGEDPNMLRYIEQELAKRRGAGGDEGGDGAGPSGGGAKSAEERLWDTPDELRMKKTEGEETADRWLTGIVEVQLPADYKIKNIEATERAKAKMLEGIHGGGDDAGMEHPHSRQAAFAASRAALRKEDDGGFQKAEASANLKLQRKEFATSFGKGFASKAKKPRH